MDLDSVGFKVGAAGFCPEMLTLAGLEPSIPAQPLPPSAATRRELRRDFPERVSSQGVEWNKSICKFACEFLPLPQ